MDRIELVKKFLNNQCNAEEAAQATQMLADDPGLLDQLMPASEWESSGSISIPDDLEQELRTRIIAAVRKARILTMVRAAAVAASIFLVISATYFFIQDRSRVSTTNVANIEKIGSPRFDTVYNSSANSRELQMTDGSIIELYGRSMLVYSKDFNHNRQIALEGTARFKVAKNPDAPFIVRSGAITTTALGTEFKIDGLGTAAAINVKLYEGKVVIRATDKRLVMQDTYLQPGEQCLVDLSKSIVQVSRMDHMPDRSLLAIKPGKIPVVKEKEQNLSLSFEKTGLVETFERLQNIFDTRIQYDGAVFNKMLFTGHFEQGDQLADILTIIANMNGLQVEEKNGVFHISKNKLNQVSLNASLTQVPDSTVRLPVQVVTDAPLTRPAVVDAKEKNVQEKPVLPADAIKQTAEGIAYQKVPLEQVFNRLEKAGQIRINYTPEDIKELFFTGTIPGDMTAEDLLQIICNMNGLKLIKNKRRNFTIVPALP